MFWPLLAPLTPCCHCASLTHGLLATWVRTSHNMKMTIPKSLHILDTPPGWNGQCQRRTLTGSASTASYHPSVNIVPFRDVDFRARAHTQWSASSPQVWLGACSRICRQKTHGCHQAAASPGVLQSQIQLIQLLPEFISSSCCGCSSVAQKLKLEIGVYYKAVHLQGFPSRIGRRRRRKVFLIKLLQLNLM